MASCFMLPVDWPVVAQMVTASAAVSALFVAPWLSFKASRRLAIAQSRQQWLDGLRADIAELISLHEEIVIVRARARLESQPTPHSLLEMRRVRALTTQIRMRLNVGEPDQLELNRRISTFVTTYNQDAPDYNPNLIIEAVDPIARKVWADIKSAKA